MNNDSAVHDLLRLHAIDNVKEANGVRVGALAAAAATLEAPVLPSAADTLVVPVLPSAAPALPSAPSAPVLQSVAEAAEAQALPSELSAPVLQSVAGAPSASVLQSEAAAASAPALQSVAEAAEAPERPSAAWPARCGVFFSEPLLAHQPLSRIELELKRRLARARHVALAAFAVILKIEEVYLRV